MRRLTLFITVLLLIAGCSNTKETTNLNSQSSEESSKIITVGFSDGPKPFVFMDNGVPSGYEIDLLRAVDEKLPQYSFEYQITEFTGIFGSLDSGRFQIIANSLTKNLEREEKYLFSIPSFKYSYGVVVREDDNSIKKLSDLSGKTANLIPGGNYATVIEEYNKSNPENQVEIIYNEVGFQPIFLNIESGKADFTLTQGSQFSQFNKELGYKLKFVPFSEEDSSVIGSPYVNFFYGKSEQAKTLKEEVDKVLLELKNDGSLAELSKQYFDGKDYTPPIDEMTD